MLWIDAIANYELDVVFLSVFLTAVTKIETRRLRLVSFP